MFFFQNKFNLEYIFLEKCLDLFFFYNILSIFFKKYIFNFYNNKHDLNLNKIKIYSYNRVNLNNFKLYKNIYILISNTYNDLDLILENILFFYIYKTNFINCNFIFFYIYKKFLFFKNFANLNFFSNFFYINFFKLLNKNISFINNNNIFNKKELYKNFLFLNKFKLNDLKINYLFLNFFKGKNLKHRIKFCVCDFFKNVNFKTLNYLNILFLRKLKFFNKGRYSRNRQYYRTGVYWCFYINIIAVVGIYFWFYRFNMNFGYLWWLFYVFFISFIFSKFLKFNFFNIVKLIRQFYNSGYWIFLIFFNFFIFLKNQC